MSTPLALLVFALLFAALGLFWRHRRHAGCEGCRTPCPRKGPRGPEESDHVCS